MQRTSTPLRFKKLKSIHCLLALSGAFLLLLTIQGCKKDKSDTDVFNDPVELAKNGLIIASKDQIININNQSYRQNLGRQIHWEKASSRKNGDSTLVYVPITLSQDLLIKDGGKVGVSLNTISWLVSSEVSGKYKFYLVTKVPDKNMPSSGKFTGLMLVDDWFGKGKSYYVEQGNPTKNTSTIKNGTNIMNITCKAISYQICAGDDFHCYQHTDYYCINSDKNTELSVDPDYGIGGGGGSGSSSAPGTGTISAGEFMTKIDAADLKPCFLNVLTSLKQVNNNCIANTLDVFSGEIPGYNWKMKDGNTGEDTNAITSSIYDRVNGVVTTTFNSSNYTEGSDLAIAKTILHESVHAYLVSYFSVDQASALKDYSQYYDDYYSNKHPNMNDEQHNEMTRTFIGSIADQLKEFGKSKGYDLSDQFYNDLAWGGLTGTKAFKAFTSEAQKRIKNVILSEQSGKDMDGNTSTPKGKQAGC